MTTLAWIQACFAVALLAFAAGAMWGAGVGARAAIDEFKRRILKETSS